MKIDLKSPTGIRLLTGGRFCTENIDLAPALQSKTVTENGTVSPDEGYAGLGQVVVAVPTPDGYIKPAGTTYITANGIYDVTAYASVTVSTPVAEAVEEYDGTVTVA